jgi:hypothetical protein
MKPSRVQERGWPAPMTALFLVSCVGGVVAASLAQPVPARERCHGKQVVTQVEMKTCPATPRRPALVVKRACCAKPDGRQRCKPFPHCPSN